MRRSMTGAVALALLLLSGCAAALSAQTGPVGDILDKLRRKAPDVTSLLGGSTPITTGLSDAAFGDPPLDGFTPNEPELPLTDLQQTPGGAFLLQPGYYTADAQSYCLHAGTHGPGGGDGYLYAPPKGRAQDAVVTIVRNSVRYPDIEQREIQLLIWAVLARAKFEDLSPQLRATAARLLSPKQLATLNRSALDLLPGRELDRALGRISGLARRVAEAEARLRQLLTTPGATYGEIERVAVLGGAAPRGEGSRQVPAGRWSRHPDGYYVRYQPGGYSTMRVEVWVPGGRAAARGATFDEVAFTPGRAGLPAAQHQLDLALHVAVPGNTGSQRLLLSGRVSIPLPSRPRGRGNETRRDDRRVPPYTGGVGSRSGSDELGRGERPRPTPTPRTNVPPPVTRPCNFNAPPDPPPPPPHSLTVCNLQELASRVHERYGTGEPIRLIRVKNRPNTYLLLLSGMEGPWLGNAHATGLEDALEEAGNESSFLRRWVMHALQQARQRGDLPAGANVIMAGHSLGGMVEQNMLADGSLGSLGLRVPQIITFGSPITAPRVDGTSYVYVEHEEDNVLKLFNRQRGRVRLGGQFKVVTTKGGPGIPDAWGHHDTYHTNAELKHRSLSGGTVSGRRNIECLELDLDHSFSFTAPSLAQAKNKVSEAIGEAGMEAEAKRLKYWPLVPPSKASNRPQGYDGVYWDPQTHAIVIGEAKGGSARLETGYGYKQGTIEWAKAAANAIVKSRTANSLEERYALLILCALDESTVKMARGNYRLSFCERLQDCKPPVRIELFHTENRDGSPGRTTHKVLARYP